jgi:predicted small secreted protein
MRARIRQWLTAHSAESRYETEKTWIAASYAKIAAFIAGRVVRLTVPRSSSYGVLFASDMSRPAAAQCRHKPSGESGNWRERDAGPGSDSIIFVKHEVNMFGRCVGMLLLAAALFSLSGCNTVAGFGQDISGASRSVQRAL